MLPTTFNRSRLSPATALGAVSLTVSDLGRSRAFYEEVLGLSASEPDSRSVTLAAHLRRALRMDTLRLDLEDLLQERDRDRALDSSVAAGTRIGHVHLRVSDIARAGEFCTERLGFDPTVTDFPGALFVSAGGYHHHVGVNTLNSAGASPPTPGSVGLRSFEIIVGAADELRDVSERLRAGGAVLEPAGSLSPTDGHDAMLIRDPSGTAVVLRST